VLAARDRVPWLGSSDPPNRPVRQVCHLEQKAARVQASRNRYLPAIGSVRLLIECD
jgi:hypothetical protein